MFGCFLYLITSTMGVTLERVQNKFACIIGELCSEPVLLSQFAIWVDLRISEYKSKGTISLDCSGDNPDPSWLKGHINPPPRRAIEAGEIIRQRPGPASARNSLPHKNILGSRDPSRLSNLQRLQESARTDQNVDYDHERLSPDVVLVKEEPTDSDVFPVTLHRHGNSSPSGRKRTADSEPDSLQSDGSFFHSQNQTFSSPSKMRRVDSASDDGATLDSQSNQSFMSIIGLPEQDYTEGGDLNQSDMSLSMMSGDEHKGGNSFSFRQTTAAATATLSSPSTSDAASRLNASANAVPEHQRTIRGKSGTVISMATMVPLLAEQPLQYTGRTRHRDTKSIRARIVHIREKSEKTIGNIVGAVGSFESWLWVEHGIDQKAESIVPEVLDSYLVEFFSVVKKPNGMDYDPDSFTSFRSYLERFLKEHDYPCSICKSPQFANSQLAFKHRRKVLLLGAHARRKEKLQNAQVLQAMSEPSSLELENLTKDC